MEVPDISENVREARIKAGFTQEQLAKKAGFTKTYISRIENNRATSNNVSLYVAFNLAKSLNVSLDYLVGEKTLEQSETEQLMLLLQDAPQDKRDEFIRFCTIMFRKDA